MILAALLATLTAADPTPPANIIVVNPAEFALNWRPQFAVSRVISPQLAVFAGFEWRRVTRDAGLDSQGKRDVDAGTISESSGGGFGGVRWFPLETAPAGYFLDLSLFVTYGAVRPHLVEDPNRIPALENPAPLTGWSFMPAIHGGWAFLFGPLYVAPSAGFGVGFGPERMEDVRTLAATETLAIDRTNLGFLFRLDIGAAF